ncbi:MAG: DNA-binding transcriptional regulator GbsR (MarR family) [Halobacteriales archaeon]|jgi:DNA-binding transcriptional regulator GbsR (MarR family)
MSESSATVQDAREEVISALERAAEIYGLNRSYGRLYGILYFEEEPVSLDELVERSGYAKSTVSTVMRKMERLHFAHRQSQPGEGKKAFFEAERDFWYIVQRLLEQEGLREIEIMQRALSSAIEDLEAADGEVADRDLERVRSLKATYDRWETLVSLLTSRRLEKVTDLVKHLRASGDESA